MNFDNAGNELNEYGFRKDFDWNNRFDLKTKVDGYEISTVDLGLDHSFGGEKPLYYETMIFLIENIGKIDDRKENIFEDYQVRYSTQEEAIEGHRLAIEFVKEVLKNNEKKIN